VQEARLSAQNTSVISGNAQSNAKFYGKVVGCWIREMTLASHCKLVVWGFHLAFYGLIGTMIGSTMAIYTDYSSFAVRDIFLPMLALGAALVLFANLSHIAGERKT